jgi:TonB family protein
MEDRIGDLLTQRAQLGGGAGAGIALSILIHASIAAAFAFAAMHATAPQTMSTLNIRFAPAASAVAPLPVTIPAKKPAPSPAPIKPVITEPVAEPPKVTAKPEPKTVPFSAFGHSPKKGSETPPAPRPAPPTPAAQIATRLGVVGGIEIPIGTAGVTGLEGGDFPYTIYIDRMKALIGQRWLRPQVRNGIVGTVSFVIDRDGTIRDAKNEILSGDGTFDRAALRAVLEASPLPPLPFAYDGTYLGVHLTFR